jgi:hypothetical protein
MVHDDAALVHIVYNNLVINDSCPAPTDTSC